MAEPHAEKVHAEHIVVLSQMRGCQVHFNLRSLMSIAGIGACEYVSNYMLLHELQLYVAGMMCRKKESEGGRLT
jgi:hypothetical protein